MFHQHFPTNRAMLAFRKSRFNAGSVNCRVDDLGVTECVNDLLCNEDFPANVAVLAFCQTGFGTSGRDCLVDDLGVGFARFAIRAIYSIIRGIEVPVHLAKVILPLLYGTAKRNIGQIGATVECIVANRSGIAPAIPSAPSVRTSSAPYALISS